MSPQSWTTEDLAKLFYDTYESLAPTFDCKKRLEPPVEWDELPDKMRRLMTATVSVVDTVMHTVHAEETLDPQSMEFQRNVWQRRCGALLTFIEEAAKLGSFDRGLLDGAYAVVNQNPYTKSFDDPHGDVVHLTTRYTIDAAIAAGLVVPGPNWNDQEARPKPHVPSLDSLEKLIENYDKMLTVDMVEKVDTDLVLHDLRELLPVSEVE